MLSGCNYVLFDPKGPIAEQAMELIIISVIVMLVVVIPVTIMGVWFPFKYSATNKKNTDYQPDWEHSNKIEAWVWGVPIVIIIILAYLTYVTSHELDPREPIPAPPEATQEELVIQVVALDWKWLFIYPEEQVATINEIAVPVNVPVKFLITSATVMNSFFIPHLGSQIYAMSGMENRLHLMATEEGVYPGMSANYSGFGFSGMKFNTHATTQEGYEAWIEKVRNSGNSLDSDLYAKLAEKSRDVPPSYYALENPLLFKEIIESFTGGFNGQ